MYKLPPIPPQNIHNSPKITKNEKGNYDVVLGKETSTSMKDFVTIQGITYDELMNMQKSVKLFVDNLLQSYSCFTIGGELIELNLTSNSFAQDVIAFEPQKTWEKELLNMWRFAINFEEAEKFIKINI